MGNKCAKNSMFLFIDDGDDIASIRSMLSRRAVTFYEAPNLFDAVEELSDYTVTTKPDLVMVPLASGEPEAEATLRMFGHVGPGPEPTMIVYSGKSKSPNVVCDIDQLSKSLDRWLAVESRTASTAAN